jgi:hypothetical protein
MTRFEQNKEEARRNERIKSLIEPLVKCYHRQRVSSEAIHCLVRRCLNRWGIVIGILCLALAACSEKSTPTSNQIKQVAVLPVTVNPAYCGTTWKLMKGDECLATMRIIRQNLSGYFEVDIRIDGTLQSNGVLYPESEIAEILSDPHWVLATEQEQKF